MAYAYTEQGALRRRQQQSLANQQASFYGQQRGRRKISNIERQYGEGFQPMLASYGRRGLGGPGVESGIMRSGLTRYAEALQRDLGAETQNMQEELNQIAMKEAAEQADLEDYLTALRLQQQADIFDSAQTIKSLGAY
jgi:hypothetical protein